MCESFFATLECELLDRVTLRTPGEARTAVFDFIEGWYNPTRRHSSLEYESPLAFERRAAEGGQTSVAAAIVPATATGTVELVAIGPRS
jgi:putative transposase